MTFRQLADELTGLPGGLEFTGTPEQFADLIERWTTEGASDGFTLQQRGLHRTEYTATTLRGHLAGLAVRE